MSLGRLSNEDVIFKRKFRWTFVLGDYGGNLVVSLSNSQYKGHVCKISARPSITWNPQEVNHIIETVYLPARASWDPINITVFDIAGDDYMYQWMRSFYDPEQGIVHPIGDGSTTAGAPKKTGLLNLLDGHGSTIESWEIQGCWPENINWGELDYTSSDLVDITFTLRYDRAIIYNSKN